MPGEPYQGNSGSDPLRYSPGHIWCPAAASPHIRPALGPYPPPSLSSARPCRPRAINHSLAACQTYFYFSTKHAYTSSRRISWQVQPPPPPACLAVPQNSQNWAFESWPANTAAGTSSSSTNCSVLPDGSAGLNMLRSMNLRFVFFEHDPDRGQQV